MKDKILDAARKRLERAIDADRENREEARDDLRMLVGNQWPDEIRREREAEGKPCLTINRLAQFVRQVTGDIRRMNPAIKITPSDDEADRDTADIIEGLIRQIEYASDASSIYEQTAESAAASSIGWFRILTDWADDDTFNQEIKIKRIKNPFSVYCDPNAEDPTRKDASYIFITEAMSLEDFEEAYPDASPASVDDDPGMRHWIDGDDIVVAEYYWKEPLTKKIHLLANGQVLEGDVPAVIDVVKTRTVETHKVMWAKVSGNEVLEGPIEQPCYDIPVIAVAGEEWEIDGRTHRTGVIRYAKDAQQMYNYWRSAQTEMVALQPKAPYLVTVKQVAGLEALWKQANVKNRPYLPYNHDEKAGRPQREAPPVSSAGMAQEAMVAADDMKATTGIYDAGLGNQSNEKSGVAIRQRQMESDVSTSIYSDNMAKAIGQAGRIIVDMIPKIYDTERTVVILGADDEEKIVRINQVMQMADGQVYQNDMTRGKYDVRVSVGPNYSTMRQETAEGMLEFIRTFPAAAQVTGDLVAKSMDWPDADRFAERLKKMLPPGMRDMEDMSPEEQQQMQAQMQQQAQQAQMGQAAAQIDLKKQAAEAAEAEADAEKARFEVMNEQLDLAAKNGQLNAVIGQLVQQEVARALQGAYAAQPAPQGQFPGY